MLLWWLIFLPLLLLILICNTSLLKISPQILNNSLLGFQYKILNSASLIILARVVLVAVGLVIIMICIFFPLFRVSKEGIQWTKELEEELGEITGEEVATLIKTESFRWSLIHSWIRLKEPEAPDAHLLLRELMTTVWDAFPDYKLSVCFIKDKNCWGITHTLLPRLILGDATISLEEDRTFELQLSIAPNEYLGLRIYNSHQEGFSQIDEKFIQALGEVFIQKVAKSGVEPEQLFIHYDRIPLALNKDDVYDERG